MGGDRSEHEGEALALVREVDRLATKDLWPGFDPTLIPLAVYVPDRTYLLRHPDPPPEFAPIAARVRAHARDGLHPAVRANSFADIGGSRTATV